MSAGTANRHETAPRHIRLGESAARTAPYSDKVGGLRFGLAPSRACKCPADWREPALWSESGPEMPVNQGLVGGGGGIRTHGALAGTTVFETAPFDHSGTPPLRVSMRPDHPHMGSWPVETRRVSELGRAGRARAGRDGGGAHSVDRRALPAIVPPLFRQACFAPSVPCPLAQGRSRAGSARPAAFDKGLTDAVPTPCTQSSKPAASSIASPRTRS